MSKNALIQIRVSEEIKKKIKVLSAEREMTVSEFLLYGAMKVISEEEFYNKQMQNSFSLMPNDIQIKK